MSYCAIGDDAAKEALKQAKEAARQSSSSSGGAVASSGGLPILPVIGGLAVVGAVLAVLKKKGKI